MSSTFKILSLFFALCCVQIAAFAQSQSLFVSVYSGANFFSNEDVLKAYVGSWAGGQVVKFGDKNMRGKIEITYSPMFENSQLRLVGVGKITAQNGHSVPTTSYMYVENSTLILEMRTESGLASFYKGIIDGKSVIWIPLYDFFLYDYQQDYFFEKDGKSFMNAVGTRFFSYSGGSGMLEIVSKFEKLKDAYPMSEVKGSVQKDIKVQIGSGVKFGK